MAEQMLTIKEAAERAGVSPSLVYEWCRDQALAHYRFGAKGRRQEVMIDGKDRDPFLAMCLGRGNQPLRRSSTSLSRRPPGRVPQVPAIPGQMGFVPADQARVNAAHGPASWAMPTSLLSAWVENKSRALEELTPARCDCFTREELD